MAKIKIQNATRPRRVQLECDRIVCKADQQSDVHDGECRAKKHRKSGGLKYSYEVLAYIVDIVRVSVP